MRRAEHALAGVPGVLSVRGVRMRWVGDALRADAELEIDASTSMSDAHRIPRDGERALTGALPQLTEAVMHTDLHPGPSAAR